MKENTAGEDAFFGICKIRPVLRNVSEPTVLKWYREYDDFPFENWAENGFHLGHN
ncbi:MAG: hypothetical protein GY874_01585 [Desulfobacteraceae bacterium]|nr:hypothetical protein [Desulfobacteraceae bacterium]